VFLNALRGTPACRSKLAGFQFSLPQAPLMFQPYLMLAKVAPLFCEVASLMVLQALRKALCVTGLLIKVFPLAPALRQSPNRVRGSLAGGGSHVPP
jgi:hypothetical protein